MLIRFIAAVRDTLIVITFVAGPPIGLYALAGSPIPDELPSPEVLRDWVNEPLQPRYATTMAVASGWLLWAAITLLLAASVAANVRRPSMYRLRGYLPGPMQSLAATLLGAAAVTSATAPATASPASVAATTIPPGTPPGPQAASAPADVGIPAMIAASVTTPTTATPAPSRNTVDTCTVKPGDTLFDIAARRLGDGDRWPEIFNLNRGTHYPGVGGVLTDADLIYPGWTLKLPHNFGTAAEGPGSTPERSGAARPGAAKPSAGPDTSRPADQGIDPSGASHVDRESPQAAPEPSTRASAPDDDRRQTGGAGVASSSSTPPDVSRATAAAIPPASITAATPPDTAGSRPSPHDRDWLQVTGGFISAGLAAGLLSAAALVWQRRRHRYDPTPVTNSDLDDPDLTPPLAALTRLRRSVRQSAPALQSTVAEPEPTVREYLHAPVKPDLPPPGASGTELAGLGSLPLATGVGLTGPAAHAAARGTLVAALNAGSPDDAHAQSTVVIAASTLATLLPDSTDDVRSTSRLAVVPTFTECLTRVEEEIIRRNRLLTDHDAADVAALRQQYTFAEPLPQMLLIADTPPQDWHPRLAAAITLGAAVDIGAVLIGASPHGTTLSVAVDGSTTGADGEQIAVLDAAATTAILAMLTEAHGDITTPPHPCAAPPADNDRPDTAGTPPVAPIPDSAVAPTRPPANTGPFPWQVHARVLGRPAILDADGNPVRGLRAKSLELFVYLAVHRKGAALDDIMEALWPDVTVTRAADRLSTCVANLRTTIRAVAHTNAAKPDTKLEPVINTGGHYHLNPELLAVDWWTVLDAYTAVAAATDGATRLTHLQSAVDAIHGGLADGCDYDWIDTDREHARRRIIKIHAHAASLLADTVPPASRVLYDTACRLDPLSDRLARKAMQAAARLGDLDSVRDRLAALRRALDDAGIDIEAETEHLATTLLQEPNSR